MLARIKSVFALNTIFWKIFLSYWLATLLILAATTIVVTLYVDRDNLATHARMLDKHHVQSAQSIFEAGGVPALRRWLAHQRGSRGRMLLVNPDLKEELGRRLPPSLLAQLQGDKQLQDDKDVPPGVVSWNLVPLTITTGERYWLAQKPRLVHDRRRFLRHGSQNRVRFIYIPLAFLVSGLISFWLARNFTSPIRQLQQAARRISSGDLSARVNAGLATRSDEFGDLSRDFDGMAEQIEQLLSAQQRMLRDVSHELRSPLARLQVALELARKSAGEGANAEHDRIEQEAERLNELIGQVLSLVRLTTRGDVLNRESSDLQALLKRVVSDAEFEAQAQHKTVRYSSVDPAQPLWLNIDPDLLHSAVENIVRNGLRYAPVGTDVEVALQHDAENVTISISDHGPGVAEQELAQLFEPFYREAEARDRASGGYGLGLAIAKRAVQLHEGSIVAENIKDGGLRVTITLPRQHSA